MSEEKSDIPSPTNKQPEGKGFVIKSDPSSEPDYNPRSSFSKNSVEMRTGASNADALQRIADEEKRLARLTPEERMAELKEKIDREDRDSAAHDLRTWADKNGEYTETLLIEGDGKFNTVKRGNDGAVPYVPAILGLSNPEELLESMRKIQEENPDIKISFENDENGKWIKYKVIKNPTQ